MSQKLEHADEKFAEKATKQSEKGQYFTPKIVADRLAMDLKELSQQSISVVHDLGCGPGALSAAVLRNHSDIRIRGYDIDDSAISDYNRRFPDFGSATNLDLLINPEIGPIPAAISNPPYLTSRKLGPERTKEIRDTGYFTAVKGKLNTFSLFIELAIKELEEGGVAAFIVPIAITNLKDHRALRNMLLSECDEIRLTWLKESNCFKDQNVEVNACLISFRKGADEAILEIREWNGEMIVRSEQIDPTKYDFFPTLTFIELPVQQGESLDTEFEVIAIGFNWKKGWEEFVSNSNQDEYNKALLPIVRGKDVSKEGKLQLNSSLNYKFLKKNGWIDRSCDYELHSSKRPRLILADITSGIKVAFTESPCLPMNSVKVIYHKENDKSKLKKLRSYLMSEDAHLRLKEATPNLHLPKGNLERLKIPDWSESE